MDAMPAIRQGNDAQWTCYFKDSAGDPINITGGTVQFIMKSSVTDTDANAVISKTATITDAANGTCEFTLSDTETDIDTGEYIGEFQYTNASSEIYTLANGFVKVLEKVFD